MPASWIWTFQPPEMLEIELLMFKPCIRSILMGQPSRQRQIVDYSSKKKGKALLWRRREGSMFNFSWPPRPSTLHLCFWQKPWAGSQARKGIQSPQWRKFFSKHLFIVPTPSLWATLKSQPQTCQHLAAWVQPCLLRALRNMEPLEGHRLGRRDKRGSGRG